MNALIMSADLHVNKHTKTLTRRIAVDSWPVTSL